LDSGNTHLQNCLVISNKANYEGGAIYSTDLFPTLINSALYGNIADYKGGGIYCDAGNFEARNIIMWHNAPGEIEGNIEATYSDIEGYWPGHGNFAKDPCFVSPGSRNFSLSVGSPCIDAGDPETMNNDYCFPPSMGTVRNDMGAYGGPDACDWIQLPVMLELEVLLFPDFVLRGKFTQWKIAVRNVGEVPATVDQLKLKIQGPASFIKLLWSGSFSLAPNQETEQWLKVFVPLSSPLGQYTCTTVVYNNGEELASDSFQTEVVQ
jgi:predicted outer membrane repeat protein